MIRSKQRVLALADLVAPLFCLVTRREANLALVSVRDPAGRLSKKGLNLHLIPCSMIVAFSGLAGSESRRESEPEPQLSSTLNPDHNTKLPSEPKMLRSEWMKHDKCEPYASREFAFCLDLLVLERD